MREIKFRCWDSKLKIWINNLGMKKNNVLTSGNEKVFKVMQYTGLKDKKRTAEFPEGQEIYEGDILKFVGGTCDFIQCGIYADQKHRIGTVLCVQKLLSGVTLCLPHQISDDIPNMVGKVDNYTFWNHHKSFEVIGNIYENPELLL